MDGLKLQLQVDRKNTLYNETQRVATNARSKMYFSRHSQGYVFIAYLIKLQGEVGREVPYLDNTGMFISLSPL